VIVQRWPRWLRAVFLSAIPLVALGMLALGFWQLARLQERRAQNAAIEQRVAQAPLVLSGVSLPEPPEALDYRPAIVRGTFDPAGEIVWRNQAYQGAPGVHVITPLRLTGSDVAILVDRGWLPYTQAELEARRAYPPPAGEQAISGLLRLPVTRNADFLPADPTNSPEQPRLDAWFWLDIAQIETQTAYPLLPMLLVQAPDPEPAALPIRTLVLDLSDGPHLGYALQWFAFAAIAAFGPLIYWWRNRARPAAG